MKKSTALILSSLLAAAPLLSAEILPPQLELTISERPFILAQAAATETDEQPARKPDIHFVPTPQALVEEMLATANVQKGEKVYDLGCGDGRIVITAAKKYGANGTGIDIDPKRIREATENAKNAGMQDQVKFLKADLFESDFKDADVISLYLLTTLNRKLRPKILAETRPGTRIVSHAFTMGEWEPDAEKTVEGSTMYYWVVPANLSGTWNVKGEGKPKVDTVTIDQNFQKISGTVQVDGKSLKIGDGKITGEKFTFTVEPTEGGQPMKITGQIKGDQIEASAEGEPAAKWTAQRDPATKGKIAATP
jgi:SAM-dependent methyltransferase